MKRLKRLKKLLDVKRLISLIALAITLSGCKSKGVETVTIDTFCTRHESLVLDKKDFDNLRKIGYNKNNRITMNKLIDNIAINEKEFEQCLLNHSEE